MWYQKKKKRCQKSGINSQLEVYKNWVYHILRHYIYIYNYIYNYIQPIVDDDLNPGISCPTVWDIQLNTPNKMNQPAS